MACVSANKDFATVTCGSKTYIVCLSDSTLKTIEHSDYHNFNKLKSESGQIEHEDFGLGLLSSDISPCGNLLAFVTLTKTLCIVNITKSEVTVERCYHLLRGASQVKFTPITKNVILSDKAGDVYLFNPAKEENGGKLILGHLSLLLDVLVTSDEQYIITCDRDEKIRVSSFPNAYNIVTYCLGHSEFVSSLVLLPHQQHCLISTSGDSTVRFWDYKYGKELFVYNLAKEFKNQADRLSDGEVIITHAAAVPVDDKSSLLCLCLHHDAMCVVLKCYDLNDQLQYTVNQTISLNGFNPWKAMVCSNILWLVLNSQNDVTIKALSLDLTRNSFIEDLPINIGKAVALFNGQNLVVDSQSKIVDLLFKEKFDNVKEYLKKKEERLASLEPSLKRCKT